MSDLGLKLESDYIQAVKSKDQERVAALRLLKAVLKNEQIAKKSELTDEEIIRILKKEAKKRQESIIAYKQGQRADLAGREEAELNIIKEYLPPEMPDQELKTLADKILKENELTSQQDFGKAMKLVMAKTKGQVDGGRISQAVKELLSPE